LSVADIPKVFYAPYNLFKKVVENPKYLAPIAVFIIFILVQSAFYYNVYSNTYYEQTSPDLTQLDTWTQDATLWTTNQGVTITQNYQDYLNSSYYGNSSMQFAVSNSNTMSLELNIGNIDCSPTGYQNLSMRIKQVDPQAPPNSVTLTLYSLSSSNSYTRDLTNDFSNASLISVWNNITVPVSTNASDWQTTGNPQWQNITGLKLEFSFTSNSSITLRAEGIFFRGVYQTPVQSDFTGFLIYVLQLVVIQYLFQWIIFTGLVYVLIKVLKGNITWKPIFVAIGIALAVTIIQSIIGIAVTAYLPTVNYPVELLVNLPSEAQTLMNSIAAQTATYSLIIGVVQLAFYGWIIGLGTTVVKALQPEFTLTKSILTSAAAFIITIILISLLGV
jgi:hypothetical protein